MKPTPHDRARFHKGIQKAMETLYKGATDAEVEEAARALDLEDWLPERQEEMEFKDGR